MVNGASLRADQGGKMQEKETLDEKLPGLFEPDTLLPIQYFEAMRRKHLLEGEKRLILSVLEDAIECFMKCIDCGHQQGSAAVSRRRRWINLEDKHWVFSFDNVCDMLDINPSTCAPDCAAGKKRSSSLSSAVTRNARSSRPSLKPRLYCPRRSVSQWRSRRPGARSEARGQARADDAWAAQERTRAGRLALAFEAAQGARLSAPQ